MAHNLPNAKQQNFLIRNSCLLYSKMKLIRKLRQNQNCKIVANETTANGFLMCGNLYFDLMSPNLRVFLETPLF